MKGWKTWIGCTLIALSAVLRFLGMAEELVDALLKLGYAVTGVGVAHKIEKGLR